jgi:hypothetical protein
MVTRKMSIGLISKPWTAPRRAGVCVRKRREIRGLEATPYLQLLKRQSIKSEDCTVLEQREEFVIRV